jgi:hypothetical protein
LENEAGKGKTQRTRHNVESLDAQHHAAPFLAQTHKTQAKTNCTHQTE